MIQGLFTQEAITILTVYTLKKQTLAKTSHGKESILYNYSWILTSINKVMIDYL